VFIKVSKAQRVQGDGVSTGNQEGTCIVSVKGMVADRGDHAFDVSDKLTDSGAAKKLLLPRSRVGRVDKGRKDVFSLHVSLGEPSAPDVNAPRLVARRDASRRHHNKVKSVKEVRACDTQLTLNISLKSTRLINVTEHGNGGRFVREGITTKDGCEVGPAHIYLIIVLTIDEGTGYWRTR